MKPSSILSFAPLLSLGFLVLGAGTALPAVTELAKEGKAALPIVVSANASPELKASAQDLADMLSRITNATFQVETGDGTHGIVVGTVKHFPALAENAPFDQQNPARWEDYLLRSEPHRVILLGTSDLAADRAVWDLLHRLGYRQYFPAKEWEIIPHRRELFIEVDRFEKPDFNTRLIWYNYNTWSEIDFDGWMRKNRVSNRQQGGYLLTVSHSYGTIMRMFKEEFDEDPALRSEVNGAPGSKLRIGNAKVDELAIQFATRYFEKNPTLFSVSIDPSDGGGWGDSPEELAMGTISDRVVHLANTVARAVGPHYPDKYIGISAYFQHCAPPTRERLEPNVFVSIATRFITNGQSVPELIEGWKKAGAKELGIRDYFSIHTWNQDKPASAVAGNLVQLAEQIPLFHQLGARHYSAESADNWGPCGLGYYFAARLLWNTSEASSLQATLDEFIDHCFPQSREPMTRLYATILHPARQSRIGLNTDTIGRMFRLLKEARELATDEAELTRLDHIALYTRYLTLLQRFESATGAAKAEALQDMLKLGYRIRNTGMIHSYALWRDLPARHKQITIPPEASWKAPEGSNPWKSSDPFDRTAIAEMVENGIAENPLIGFEPVYYSRNLVPLTNFPAGDAGATKLIFRGNTTIYTASPSSDGIRFLSRAGAITRKGVSEFSLYSMVGEINAPGQETAEGEENAPAYEAVISRNQLEAGSEDLPVALVTPSGGNYRVQISDHGNGTLALWPSDRPLTLEFSPESNPNIHGNRYQMVFYVPKDTKTLGGFARGKGRILNPDGATAHVLEGSQGYFSLPVDPDYGGKCWTFIAEVGQIQLLTVPPFMAPTPEQLMIPAELAKEAGAPAAQ